MKQLQVRMALGGLICLIAFVSIEATERLYFRPARLKALEDANAHMFGGILIVRWMDIWPQGLKWVMEQIVNRRRVQVLDSPKIPRGRGFLVMEQWSVEGSMHIVIRSGHRHVEHGGQSVDVVLDGNESWDVVDWVPPTGSNSRLITTLYVILGPE